MTERSLRAALATGCLLLVTACAVQQPPVVQQPPPPPHRVLALEQPGASVVQQLPRQRQQLRGRLSGVGGALFAIRTGEEFTQESFSARGNEQREAQAGERRQVGQHGPVLLAGLGEPQPRVHNDVLRRDSDGDGGVDLVGQLAPDLAFQARQ